MGIVYPIAAPVESARGRRTHQADYGLDAPGVVVGNAVAGVAARAGAGVGWAVLRRRHRVPAALLGSWLAGWGLVGLAQVGCGRGLLLIGAAKRLSTGRAVGLDLWRTRDQTGNDPAATIANAQAEGVAERVELRDGDARQLPFDDQTFRVVVSSLVLHNIPGAGGRAAAIGETVRVLKPGWPGRHPGFPQHRAVRGGDSPGGEGGTGILGRAGWTRSELTKMAGSRS